MSEVVCTKAQEEYEDDFEKDLDWLISEESQSVDQVNQASVCSAYTVIYLYYIYIAYIAYTTFFFTLLLCFIV